MKIPVKGEKGFTLIELLIVVAILGVLAAVVIPNVGRFIGRGESEAADTEFTNVQAAVVAMMVDNGISTLPNPVLQVSATGNMSLFPDTSTTADNGAGAKSKDPNGLDYEAADKDGFILYQHDITGGGNATVTVNYTATETTKGTYYVDAAGTVYRETTGYD